MAELDKSRMSEKKKLRIMKHYSKIQRRLSFYDRKLFCGDSILAAKGIDTARGRTTESTSLAQGTSSWNTLGTNTTQDQETLA